MVRCLLLYVIACTWASLIMLDNVGQLAYFNDRVVWANGALTTNYNVQHGLYTGCMNKTFHLRQNHND